MDKKMSLGVLNASTLAVQLGYRKCIGQSSELEKIDNK